MSEKAAELTRMICMGLGRRFEENACEHFARSTGECALLNGRRMAELVEKSRCTWEMMEHALAKFERRGICEDGADIRVDDLLLRFKRADLHESRPVGWFKYVERAVVHACLEILRKRGAFGRETCGNCEHLTQSNPYVCIKTGESRKKTHERCEHYTPFLTGPIQESTGIGLGRDARAAVAPWDSVNAKIDVDLLRRELLRRASSARPHSKDRERRHRQYELFVHLLHSLRDGFSCEEALACTQEQSGMGRKTLLRDLDEIRLFFVEKMSVCGQIDHLP